MNVERYMSTEIPIKDCSYRIMRSSKCCGGKIIEHLICRVIGSTVDRNKCKDCNCDAQKIIDITCKERGEVFRSGYIRRLETIKKGSKS